MRPTSKPKFIVRERKKQREMAFYLITYENTLKGFWSFFFS